MVRPDTCNEYSQIKAERVVKNSFEEQLKDTKNQYEHRLTSMRDDIYKKEREVYDLKNQINLINMRITKEGESRQNAENALRKNNENFSNDAQKFSYTLNNVSKEHETLNLKLQENDRNLEKSAQQRQDLQAQLDMKTHELDDLRMKYSLELEEKNKRISLLHQELKDLQERVNEQNVKRSLLESKNRDLSENYDRISVETSDTLNKLK